MIDKKISVSEQVANLPVEGQLIFTWSVPHADDIGLLPHSSRTLKAMIVPMLDLSLDMFQVRVDEIVRQELWVEVEYMGKKFYRVPKFSDHQTLKKDRQPNTIIDLKLCENQKESWDALEEISRGLGFQMESNRNPNGNQIVPEGKGMEEKRKEGKGIVRPVAPKKKLDFKLFWDIYPLKQGKKDAKEAWDKLDPDTQQLILNDIPRRRADDKWVNGFVKEAVRYIKKQQWEDEIRSPRQLTKGRAAEAIDFSNLDEKGKN